MEQFVLVPTSVYNKRLITQSVTKHELPKYQPSEKPTYHIDSLNKEINKKNNFQSILFSRQNLVLSTYQALNFTNFSLDGVESGIFLSDVAQQLRRKNADVPHINFILLDAAGISPTLILN